MRREIVKHDIHTEIHGGKLSEAFQKQTPGKENCNQEKPRVHEGERKNRGKVVNSEKRSTSKSTKTEN